MSFAARWQDFRTKDWVLAEKIESLANEIRQEFPSSDDPDYQLKMKMLERKQEIVELYMLSKSLPLEVRPGSTPTSMDIILWVNQLSGGIVQRQLT